MTATTTSRLPDLSGSAFNLRSFLHGLPGVDKVGVEARAAALDALKEAMDGGLECYRQWGLVPEPAQDIIASLRARGARAVRLTGAGGGGFIVALWD